MKASRTWVPVCAAAVLCVLGASASADTDTFGTGGNQFTMDFVRISGVTNPSSGYGIVNNDYRMGKLEITNDQWNKFKAAYGTVTGDPSDAYNADPFFTGTNVPTNNVSWLEAAQFVNWLNTSKGHQAAYRFTGTPGTSNYSLGLWSVAEADNGTNLYRHKDAFYYLPTEDEWVKAAYWNGTTLQTYATKAGDTLFQGNGTNGGWNYYNNGYATNPGGPWAVGSGSEELNGTFDMMGNLWERMESPGPSGAYGIGVGSDRALRGGDFDGNAYYLTSADGHSWDDTSGEYNFIGFRVASEVPEPCSLGLLSLGGLLLLKRRRGA